MARILLCLVLFGVVGCERSGTPEFGKIRGSIYKIYSNHQRPNFLYPWKGQGSSSSSGTGFYIGDKRIMTNAHVVANSKYIEVQKDGDSVKVPAVVTFVAHDADMAILTVSERNYFVDQEPIKIGKMPKLQSPVAAIGYPMGGEQLSITEGVVSRMSYRKYSHSGSFSHLLVQVDSAINPGNSGGPVVQNGRLAGIAFQGHTAAENTGYLIPPEVVQRFLKDIADGQYDGHPENGLSIQSHSLTHPDVRSYFGLPKNKLGVKVSFITETSCFAGKLAVDDVIMKVNGKDVGVDGKVNYLGERVDFRALVDLQLKGDKVNLEIYRDGKKKEIAMEMPGSKPRYLKGDFYGKRPNYYVFGGLVFTALSRSYLKTWGKKWYMSSPTYLRILHFYGKYLPEAKDKSEMVVLANRLPHPVNTFAQEQMQSFVKSVNGKLVNNLKELKAALEGDTGEFLQIQFYESTLPVVLPRKLAQDATAAINEAYSVQPSEWFGDRKIDGAVGVN